LLSVVYFWGLWFVVLALCPKSSEGGVVLRGLGFEQLRLWFSYLLVQVQGSVVVRFSDTSKLGFIVIAIMVVVVVVSPSSKVLRQFIGCLVVAVPCRYIVRPSFLASVFLEKVQQQVYHCEGFVIKVLGQVRAGSHELCVLGVRGLSAAPVVLSLLRKCPTMLGKYIASAPLTLLVKPGGGIRPIAVGTIWRRLVSKVSATMIGHSLDGYLVGLQFGVGVPGGGEAILHAVNHLVEDRGDDVGLLMILVDFQNAFNLAWYLDDGTIVGDTLVVGKVLELITEDGPRCGLHLNIDKTELFWTKEDPRCRLEGIFPPNISRPLHGVKLLGGPVSVDVDSRSALVMKRVSSTIGLLDAVAKINDPQCELLHIRECAGVSKLYFASAQLSFDMALRSCLERIVTASGPGFGDWQWRLATLPFAFGGLGVYSAGDVLNYDFIALRLQSAALQTKLLRHVGIVTSGSTFDDALCVFNNAMEIDFLSVPLFSISKPCSACSKVFTGDVYGDHVVSCAGVIGIKHRHNTVRDTLIDICSRSGISAGKEVDIGVGGDGDKALRPANMLLYSWEGGLDVCVDLKGSSPLKQTGMTDFVPGRVVIDDAQRKRGKYMTKCAYIGYGFHPFSFSSFGELEKDAFTLLKRGSGSFPWLKILGPALLFTFLIGLVFPLLKEWGPR
ncbi:hypothetical protein Tco_0768014, partial [Tanacetum coccineum]